MKTAAVILGAGASTRFGSPKQLARLGGRTLVEQVIATAQAAGLDPIVTVLPSDIDTPTGAVGVVNDDPAAGQSRSLRLGLAALDPDVGAAVILVADQPTIPLEALLAVVTEPDTGLPIVAAAADGRLGPPVMIRRGAFALTDEISGDRGLRNVLADRPELVKRVDVGIHAPDVDTVEDLERLGERCLGCHELYLPLEMSGAAHPYIGASSACWQAFSEVIAREFGDIAYGIVHRHTVDTYAVQHPGEDARRERQSVAVHLVGLCHWLEHGLAAAELNPMTQALASPKADWPWLTPPERYDMTVVDVLRTSTGEEHVRQTRSWAESVWEAWAPHHAVVRAWAAEALRERR
jgi:CTP:molybdopterin cytidylyltransferase MocA